MHSNETICSNAEKCRRRFKGKNSYWDSSYDNGICGYVSIETENRFTGTCLCDCPYIKYFGYPKLLVITRNKGCAIRVVFREMSLNEQEKANKL